MKPTEGSHGHSSDDRHNDDVAHEHSDINIPALAWSMVIMFGTVIVTAVLMLLLFNFLEGQAAARDPKLSPLAMPATNMPNTNVPSQFFGGAPDPKLMTDEPTRLREVRASEHDKLHGYGWIDQTAGVARISIDRAKELTAQRGLAVRPDPLTDQTLGTRRPASGESSAGRTITKTLHPPSSATPAAAPAHKSVH